MLSAVEYEDLSVHQLVEVFDALSQLAMETPTVRAYIDDVAEREEEWELEEKREAATFSFSSSSSMRLPAQDRERVVRSHPHVRGVHALTHCEDPETWDPRTVE